MIPRDVTIAVVEDELPTVTAYAQRHGWTVTWLPDSLALLADGRHPDGSAVRLHADVEGYRAVPPAWRFIPPDADTVQPHRFPQAGALPGGVGSIFHSNRVICAPFNSLAYSDHGGPHNDWNGPGAWLDVRRHVRAITLDAMLAQIVSHLHYSPGWHA